MRPSGNPAPADFWAEGAGLDPAVRPQDDFYGFVNGIWTDTFALPPHRSEITMLTLLADQVWAQVAAVIREAAMARDDLPARQIADLYESFMDGDRIEQRGAAALETGLGAILSARDTTELASVAGRLQAEGVRGVTDFSVSADTREGSRYVLVLSLGGLGLPAASLYHHPGQAGLRDRYAKHIAVMLAHAGVVSAGAAAADAIRLEAELAACHETAGRRPGSATHPVSYRTADLASRPGGFPWAAWLRGFGQVPEGATILARPRYFPEVLDNWWISTDLSALKNYFAWRFVHEMAPYGPGAIFDENFDFYRRVLTEFNEPWPRWMRAASFVHSVHGSAVAERYLTDYLAPGSLECARKLVDALVASYRKRLQQNTWMQEETRKAALLKLDNMIFEIGFPRNSARPAGPRADPRDLVGNVRRWRAWNIARELARLGTPVDRSDWKVYPQSVTAYYRHGLNQVVIPAALLQPPVFDPGGDAACNFARLGAIICHEISHAFDSRGSRYDMLGREAGWWAPEDHAGFRRRSAILIAQYDSYVQDRIPEGNVSGTRTHSENLADIAGLIVAQDAFANYLCSCGQADAVTAGEEMSRFFLYWASMWREKRTPRRMAHYVATDSHAPAKFRCNGALGHVTAFYETFGLQPGDGLYISPESRVVPI
jgi:putative endopeptidase